MTCGREAATSSGATAPRRTDIAGNRDERDQEIAECDGSAGGAGAGETVGQDPGHGNGPGGTGGRTVRDREPVLRCADHLAERDPGIDPSLILAARQGGRKK